MATKDATAERASKRTPVARGIKQEPAKRVLKYTTAERVLSTAEARMNLSETLGRVAYGGERVLIGKRGKPMAALVSIADLEALRALEDAIDLEESRKARRQGGKNVRHAEVGERLGLR